MARAGMGMIGKMNGKKYIILYYIILYIILYIYIVINFLPFCAKVRGVFGERFENFDFEC